jgi:N-carbamoylputrescine amidase
MLRMKPTFRVGPVQMRCSPDPRDNVKRALDHLKRSAKKGAEIVCLPELFRSQYFCQREDTALFDLAETIPGPTSEAFSKAVKRLGVAVRISMPNVEVAGLQDLDDAPSHVLA